MMATGKYLYAEIALMPPYAVNWQVTDTMRSEVDSPMIAMEKTRHPHLRIRIPRLLPDRDTFDAALGLLRQRRRLFQYHPPALGRQKGPGKWSQAPTLDKILGARAAIPAPHAHAHGA